MAGFQVSINGRFWVSTEGRSEVHNAHRADVPIAVGTDSMHGLLALDAYSGQAERSFRAS
jgi:hypothetical protein